MPDKGAGQGKVSFSKLDEFGLLVFRCNTVFESAYYFLHSCGKESGMAAALPACAWAEMVKNIFQNCIKKSLWKG